MKPIRFHHENLARHDISPQEVRECVRGRGPKYLRKARRGIYQLIAQTAAGRYLEVLYRDLSEELYVFHAMDARAHQIRLVKRRGKRR
jgi:hypothetical protein